MPGHTTSSYLLEITGRAMKFGAIGIKQIMRDSVPHCQQYNSAHLRNERSGSDAKHGSASFLVHARGASEIVHEFAVC